MTNISSCRITNVYAPAYRRCSLRGAVLLAPMLSLGNVSSNPANKLLRHVAHVLNALWPHAPIVSGARATRLPDVQHVRIFSLSLPLIISSYAYKTPYCL